MMRFAAPPHTSEVFLPSGPAPVVDGFVTLADDAPDSDVRALAGAGFRPVAESAPAPAPAAVKAKD